MLAASLVLAGCAQSPEEAARGVAAPAANVPSCAIPVDDETFLPGDDVNEDDDIAVNPEQSSGYRSGMKVVEFADFGAVTANPTATLAACRTLQAGGTAADALISAQTALGLVEPQSSGLGGGSFVVYYDAKTGETTAYDARETAPAAATEDYLRYLEAGNAAAGAPQPSTRLSGRAIGVPGTVRLFETLHEKHGKQAWGEPFNAAIRLAESGFSVGPRLGGQLASGIDNIRRDENMSAYFLNEAGETHPVGAVIQNQAYADTLRAIAAGGADVFYTGEIAQNIVDSVASESGGRTAGMMTLEDLANYRVIERPAVCDNYRDIGVCSMSSPSSGGIAVSQALKILEHFDLSGLGPDTGALDGGIPSADAIHLITEAERLAYADRDAYVADADFVPLPGGSPDLLLAPDYIAERAALINMETSMGKAEPGEFPDWDPSGLYADVENGTSHISVVDSYGNVAAMTTTIEAGLGSFHMSRDGFLLNNELTDFSVEPADANGTPIANRIEANKRPRSSMAPTIMYELNADGSHGAAIGSVGSPGGGSIIQFVIKTIVAMVDWNMDPQQAVSMANVGAANSPRTNFDAGHPLAASDEGLAIVADLRSRGHDVSVSAQGSGLGALLRTSEGRWAGGADPRREGIVLGGAIDGGDGGDGGGDGGKPNEPRKPERVDTDIS
ncbi:gamma-glutamyltransferase family protein [Nonlabens tegetincola]